MKSISAKLKTTAQKWKVLAMKKCDELLPGTEYGRKLTTEWSLKHKLELNLRTIQHFFRCYQYNDNVLTGIFSSRRSVSFTGKKKKLKSSLSSAITYTAGTKAFPNVLHLPVSEYYVLICLSFTSFWSSVFLTYYPWTIWYSFALLVRLLSL